MPATVAFVGTKAKQKTVVFQCVAHTLVNRHATLHTQIQNTIRPPTWGGYNASNRGFGIGLSPAASGLNAAYRHWCSGGYCHRLPVTKQSGAT